MIYSADFETTVDSNDCRVWAVGIFEIFSKDNFIYGNSIDFLFDFLLRQKETTTLYFHNLKFDGEFIIDWLFRNGYEHIEDKKGIAPNEFTTLISDMGAFYSMTICLPNSNKVEIIDSLKILPFSVKQIADGFKLPIKKGVIDYKAYRAVGHKLTQEEISYLRNDVEIVARALETIFSQNLPKMTQGSNALHDFKSIVGKRNFKRWFPKCWYDEDVRRSYKGGFTYLNPIYANKLVGKGYVLDVNSLYPSVMYFEKLPYGEGKHFEGNYKLDKLYPLYTITFTCTFDIKDGYIPTVQIKGGMFADNEYLTSSNGYDVTLTMTSVDFKLFQEHYHIYNIVYHGGWKFKCTNIIFKDYIDKWVKVKIQASIEGNGSMRTLAKLMLNALYGKFALNPRVTNKYPYFDIIEDRVKYKKGLPQTRDSLYIPIGTFITAYAREKTIRTSQTIKSYSLKTYGVDMYIYSDTDSIHTTLPLEECKNFMDIDDNKLGYWAHEDTFKRAKFIRQKTYIEDVYKNEKQIENYKIENPNLIHHCSDDSILKVTCCGMPSSCYENVTFDRFAIGEEFEGKLMPKHVKGGIVLVDDVFTIRG